ncbi:MAG: RsmE family RNA methyltransferase [Oscillospiraceae bacterium]
MPHRYFTDEITNGKAYLRSADAHHLADVMRCKVGEAVIICDGKGRDYECKISNIAQDLVAMDIITDYPNVSEATVAVTVYVGYPKLDKLEWIIEKCTELGAVRIVPFFSRYCVAKPKKEDAKNERYQRIAKEAAKQSGRGIIPIISMPMTFNEMLTDCVKNDIAFFCYEAGGQDLHSRLDGVRTVSVITGSEGGFTNEESLAAAKAGCVVVGLGKRILRCETAPIAALAAVMALTDNLQ